METFDWGKYFDKIFCISLADYKERKIALIKELERVGIDTKADYFEWKITVRNPFYRYIWENPAARIDGWWINNNSALNTTFAHYEILKESQVIGYNRILIIEDDVRLLKDVDYIHQVIANTPDYDICNYGGNPHDFNRQRCVELKHTASGLFYDSSEIYMLGCEFIAFGKKGIESIINHQENHYKPADSYINKMENGDDLIRISPVRQLAIQNSAYRYDEPGYTNRIEGLYRDILDLKDFNI